MTTIDQLINLMETTSLTRRQLSEASGISYNTMTGIMTRRNNTRLTTVEVILDTLGYELKIVKKGQTE